MATLSVPIVTVTAAPPSSAPRTTPRQILPFIAFGAILLLLLAAFFFFLMFVSNRRAAALAAPFEAEHGDEDLRRLEQVVPSGVLQPDGRGPVPSRNGWSQTVCVICLEKLDEGSSVRHLPCRHLFHTPCIDQWFRSQRYTCPICIAPYFASP